MAYHEWFPPLVYVCVPQRKEWKGPKMWLNILILGSQMTATPTYTVILDMNENITKVKQISDSREIAFEIIIEFIEQCSGSIINSVHIFVL